MDCIPLEDLFETYLMICNALKYVYIVLCVTAQECKQLVFYCQDCLFTWTHDAVDTIFLAFFFR
jgi:hypothetical protein